MALAASHPFKKNPPFVDYEEVLWTPQQISTMVWLDAADETTIILNGSNVSQWKDKSGNGRHVSQSTGTSQPLFTASGQNGKSVLTFDGGDALYTANNFPKSGNIEFSAFWVHTKTSAANGSVLGWGDCNGSGTASGFWDDSSALYTGWGYASGTPYKVASPGDGYNIWGYTKVAGQIATASEIWKNGVNAATSGHSTVTPNVTSLPLYVGNFAGATASALIGSIAELFICETRITSFVRFMIEGYLAHKWGLQSSLPVIHPYRTKPPILEVPLNYFTAMNLEGR